MKPDKHGKYRVNLYLNPANEKDNVIIEYLKCRYSHNDYIKEILFSLANGSNVCNMSTNYSDMNINSDMKIDPPIIEEYEPIANLESIEL